MSHLAGALRSGRDYRVTSVIVLAEVAPRLMAVEAVAKGLVSGKDVVKKLRARPDIVGRLPMTQPRVGDY